MERERRRAATGIKHLAGTSVLALCLAPAASSPVFAHGEGAISFEPPSQAPARQRPARSASAQPAPSQQRVNDQAELFFAAGEAARERQEFAKAIEHYTRALDLFRQAKDPKREVETLNGLGLSYYRD